MRLPAPAPASCACGEGDFPSAWHCACGRWKPSAQQQCEVCLGERGAFTRRPHVYEHNHCACGALKQKRSAWCRPCAGLMRRGKHHTGTCVVCGRYVRGFDVERCDAHPVEVAA